MSCMTITDNSIIISRGFQIDRYDFKSHEIINITPKNVHSNDAISDMVAASYGQYLALITSASKELITMSLTGKLGDNIMYFDLPRSASKIRLSAKNDKILVADKSGDALIYSINKIADPGTKLLGHLSLLLDILQTADGRYIITSDRDEKIRVSCYPNTYNIQTFCLGHKEFVNHLELLPHDNKYLTSTSGDGFVKIWDYENGKLCYDIDTYCDINDEELKDEFVKAMDQEGIEVSTLPIVHYAVTQLDVISSLLAVTVHNYNNLLIYSVNTSNNKFAHKLEETLAMERLPAAIQFQNKHLYVYDDVDSTVGVYKIKNDNEKLFEFSEKVKMFENSNNDVLQAKSLDTIKVLYKRKFDNVQEYQERKKQRLQNPCNK